MGATGAEPWRGVAAAQAGLITRAQLRRLGVSRRAEDWRIEHERWQLVAPLVVATFTGDLGSEQRRWLGVLHAGEGALLAGLDSLTVHGLRKWERETIQVLVPYGNDVPRVLQGFEFIRTRRVLTTIRSSRAGVPRCRVEPAALMWASRESSLRSADGLLAAVVQQRMATAVSLQSCLAELSPLRRAARFRTVLDEINGGAHSRAELDVGRMCRRHRITPPTRQVKRTDAAGQRRYTDCEWQLGDGRTLVLEVDGAFHMDVEHWEDDLARQRSLTDPSRMIVQCTARELRDDDTAVADDLIRLGAPRTL
jgi:hypothetical protein